MAKSSDASKKKEQCPVHIRLRKGIVKFRDYKAPQTMGSNHQTPTPSATGANKGLSRFKPCSHNSIIYRQRSYSLHHKFQSHQERIAIIYEHHVHKISKGTISRNFNVNHSTVCKILKQFANNGQTNRLRNHKEKL